MPALVPRVPRVPAAASTTGGWAAGLAGGARDGFGSQESGAVWRALPELLPGLWLAAWTAEANDYGETDEYGDPHDVAYKAKVKTDYLVPARASRPRTDAPTHSRLLCALHPTPVRWSTTAERPWGRVGQSTQNAQRKRSKN